MALSTLKKIRTDLRSCANPIKAATLQRFFKTGVGEYGAGDKFLGVTVPQQRQIAKLHRDLPLTKLQTLLASPLHEERLTALLILVLRYKQTDPTQQQKIYDFYFANVAGINNWDLVDLSAPSIVGLHLLTRDKSILTKLIIAENLWLRRIAIVATWQFIRNNHWQTTLTLAKKSLSDPEDLIHKANGWMLREIGKRDFAVLDSFLRKHYQAMPRTMLRYAIEKFPKKLRLAYLHNKI